jgi:hypothetical protein
MMKADHIQTIVSSEPELLESPRKKAKVGIELGSDIEDVTDDVVFKKTRVTGSAIGQKMMQRSLTDFKWPKLTGEAKAEHVRRNFEGMREEMDEFRAAEERGLTQRKEKAKQLARERQQRHRDKVKLMRDVSAGKSKMQVCLVFRDHLMAKY